MSVKLVIISALEREIAPLVRGWAVSDEGVAAAYRCFVRNDVAVICAGIGYRAALRSTDSALSLYEPELVISAGLAGALSQDMQVGDEFIPEAVFNSKTGMRIPTEQGHGVLVSASEVAGPEAKRLLARQYSAMAVDMEAAAVAEVAALKGVRFMAVKTISDAYDFPVPDMDPFVDANGRFLTRKFVSYAVMHPGLWGVVRKLAVNSSIASQKLCSALRNLIETGKWQEAGKLGLHPAANQGRPGLS